MSSNNNVGLWMPIFLKDRRARASVLSHYEHGILTLFEMLMWEHGAILPDDDKALARNLRLSPKAWREVRDLILQDCEVGDGFIRSPAIEKEYRKASGIRAQKVLAGKASAERRKANGCSTGVATADQPRAGVGAGGGAGAGGLQFGGMASFGGDQAIDCLRLVAGFEERSA